MESEDLQLIEIAGEDDSLLQPIPTIDDTTANNNNVNSYFLCSPLQIPIFRRKMPHLSPSTTRVLKDSVDMEKPSCSSPKGSSNKENMNMNKPEVPKLSLEPLQMKRRKKGGGYNLRKSLAWDRAFFTEEGVLDPLELSMLSGTFTNSCGEALSVIDEGGKSFSDYYDCNNKEISATALNEDGVKGGCFLRRHDPSARDNLVPSSMATGKVFTIHGRGIGSKGGGCPRPTTSSSYPFLLLPGNVNIAKAAIKESNLPTIVASKTVLPSFPSTKSTVLSSWHSKHNLIAQPAITIEKNVESKSSSKNVKWTKNNAKPSPKCMPLPAKSSAQHSRCNMVNSPLEVYSLKNPQPPLIGKTNSVLEVIRDPVVPSIGVHSSDGQDRSTVAVSLPQNLSSIHGKKQHAQIQTKKPSGLRMPSPSLGFFGQPKTSVSLGLSQRNTQPCNIPESSIPSMPKFGELRPPHAPGKKPKMVDDTTRSLKTELLSSSTKCPSQITGASSALYVVPFETMKLELEVNKVQYDPESSKPVNNEDEVHNMVCVNEKIVENVEHDKGEKLCKEDTKLQMNDKNLPFGNGSYKKLRDGDNQEKAIIVFPGSKDSSENDLENSKSVDQHSCEMHLIGVSGTKDTLEHQHGEEKLHIYSLINHGVITDSQSGYTRSYGEQTSSEVHGDWVSSMQDCDKLSKAEAESIKPFIVEAHWLCHRNTGNLKPKDSTGNLFRESHINESGSPGVATFKVPESCGGELENCHVSLQNGFKEKENISGTGLVDFTDESLLEDSQQLAPNEIVSGKICSNNLSTSEEQCGQHLEHQSHCVEVEQNSNHNSLDEYILFAENKCSEEPLGEEVIRSVPYVVVERSDAFRSESNDSKLFLTPMTDGMQDGGSHVDKRVDSPPVEEAPLDPLEIAPSVEHHEHSIDPSYFSLDVELRGEATSLKFDAPLNEEFGVLVQNAQMSLNGGLYGIQVDRPVNDIIVKGAKLRNSLDNSPQVSQRIKTNGGSLFEETGDYEESQKYYFDNIADDTSIIRDSTGDEFRSSYGVSQVKNTEQTNEGAVGVDYKINKTVGDVQMLSLSGNLLPTAPHAQYLKIVDCNTEFEKQVDLPNSFLLAEQPSKDMYGLHLVDSLLSRKSTNSADLLEENVLESVVKDKAATTSILFEETRDYEESQKYYFENILDDPSIIRDSRGDEFLSSYGASQVKNTEQANEGAVGVDYKINKTVEDVQMLSLSGNLLPPAPHDQCLKIVDCNTESEKQLELSNPSLLAEQSSKEMYGLHLLDSLLRRKSTNSADPLEENVLESVAKDKDETTSIKEPENVKEGDNIVMKPAVNAVPFTDEWLAAIEAAGEEILTMKSGAVQNSPPDKSLPEPGPWSPVKRKNNQIGPFDCTKLTNVPPLDSL